MAYGEVERMKAQSAKHKRWRDQLTPEQQEEMRAYKAEWARNYRREHPKRAQSSARKAYLSAKYGLTQADYDEMLDQQAGGCALCGTPPDDRRLCIDHDHVTGEVRGLLCPSCNTALGKFFDDPEMLRVAVAYLDSTHVDNRQRIGWPSARWSG